jgi:hypothetical protein
LRGAVRRERIRGTSREKKKLGNLYGESMEILPYGESIWGHERKKEFGNPCGGETKR